MSDAPLLSVRGLRSGYGGKPVLQGVDLEVRRGEIVAVIGRNGVGKSTLMKTLIGLLPATAGSIRLRGEPIEALAAHQRAWRGIGYVPQGRDVFPRMTVEENLHVGESLRRGKAGDYAAAYDVFPILKERRRQRAGTMSGGQQQQLAIGRVLVGRPDLLLLDEPLGGHPALHRAGNRPHRGRSQSAHRPHHRARRAEHRHDPQHGAALLRHGQGPDHRRT